MIPEKFRCPSSEEFYGFQKEIETDLLDIARRHSAEIVSISKSPPPVFHGTTGVYALASDRRCFAAIHSARRSKEILWSWTVLDSTGVYRNVAEFIDKRVVGFMVDERTSTYRAVVSQRGRIPISIAYNTDGQIISIDRPYSSEKINTVEYLGSQGIPAYLDIQGQEVVQLPEPFHIPDLFEEIPSEKEYEEAMIGMGYVPIRDNGKLRFV